MLLWFPRVASSDLIVHFCLSSRCGHVPSSNFPSCCTGDNVCLCKAHVYITSKKKIIFYGLEKCFIICYFKIQTMTTFDGSEILSNSKCDIRRAKHKSDDVSCLRVFDLSQLWGRPAVLLDRSIYQLLNFWYLCSESRSNRLLQYNKKLFWLT